MFSDEHFVIGNILFYGYIEDFDVYTVDIGFKWDENPIKYKIALFKGLFDNRIVTKCDKTIDELSFDLCQFISVSQALSSYFFCIQEDGEQCLTTYGLPDKKLKYKPVINDFWWITKKYSYYPSTEHLMKSFIKTYELNREFVVGFDDDVSDHYDEYMQWIERKVDKWFIRNHKYNWTNVVKTVDKADLSASNERFLEHIHDFYVWCYYKDLDGIYCEDCKRWLVEKYTGVKLDDKMFKRDFYIVSNDLEPCPKCVKVRNGKYEYLSNFNIIRPHFKRTFAGKEFLEHVRTPFLKKFGRERGHEIKKYTWREVRKSPLLVLGEGDWGLIFRKKYRNKKLFGMKIDFDEIIGYSIWNNLSRRKLKLYQAREQIFQDKPMLRYIVVKEFGNEQDKLNLFEKYKNKYNIFEILSGFTVDEFYDEIGFEMLNEHFESIVKHPIIEDEWNKPEQESWWASLNENNDVYYRLQECYYYKLD